MSNLTVPTMLTIPEAAERTGLSKHYLRQLVLQGKIVYISAGRKYLINMNSLAAFLNKGERECE